MSKVLVDRPRAHPAKLLIWQKGGSLKGFAEACDPPVTQQWVDAVLGGRAKPSERFLRDLAAYLGMPEVEIRPLFEAEQVAS